METPIHINPVDTAQLSLIQRKLTLDSKIRGGVSWFFWIAGLSILNTIIYLTGNTITFIFGLGITQIIDGFMSGWVEAMGEGAQLLPYLGLVLDLCIAGMFVLFGYLGRKRYRWPIILGMVLYAIDGVILLLFEEFLGAAFHAWALISIAATLPAIKELRALEEAGANASVPGLQPGQLTIQDVQPTSIQKKTRFVLLLVGTLVAILVFTLLRSQN